MTLPERAGVLYDEKGASYDDSGDFWSSKWRSAVFWERYMTKKERCMTVNCGLTCTHQLNELNALSAMMGRVSLMYFMACGPQGSFTSLPKH
jgi:hypothetical protein